MRGAQDATRHPISTWRLTLSSSFSPGRSGGYLTNFEYRTQFDLAAKDMCVPGLYPHELRHTCASLAIAAGANVLAVQRLLGHDTATMTLDTYGHLFSDDLTKVAESLNDAAGKVVW
ncbi:MAG TPA: tyrosine-type recombinase/integrase [Mycobacterium sp.]|nr:tyrosine-type recombinase/integrase [Mycobacterium sp.]